MAVVFMTGWDAYGPANTNSVAVAAMLTAGEWTTASGSVSFNIAAPLSLTGQALQIGMTTTNCLTKTLPASYSRLIGGVRFSSNLAQTAGLTFQDSGSNQASITINSTGTISLRNGATGGTAIQTSGSSVSANSTHYLEWDITFGNTGAYQVWLDGASILSGTGDSTTTANNSANGISFSGVATGPTIIWDDFYLFDSTGSSNNAALLTSPRIETTFPTSDSAVQFSFAAAILGSNAARVTTTNAPAAGSLVLRRFTTGPAGTLNSITIMPGATSAGANYRGVVYADSGGTAPGTLMSSGTLVTGVVSGTAKDLPLTTPQSLAAATQYWIGFINDTSVVLAQSDGAASGYRAANTFASGAPGTGPTMTSGQASWLLWGNMVGVSGANYNEVNQQPPPGLYSYVYDATVGHEDLYGMAALSAMPSVVHCVAVKAYCNRSDAGAKTVSLRIKSGSTDSGGSNNGISPATTFGWLASYFPTDPDTSSAWLGSALNAATAGFKIDS